MAKTIDIFDLKPSQFALGMLEVQSKATQIGALGKKELKRFIKKNPISVVVAPNAETYIVDGHHHTAACWMAGVTHLQINAVYDFRPSNPSYKRFWTQMRLKRWCHLYDKFGDGPRDPMYLPHDIRGLADDPYRSLAWLVRHENGFLHSDETFAQFKWANFFRRRKLFAADFDLDFEAALAKALKLSRSRACRHLPGFIKT